MNRVRPILATVMLTLAIVPASRADDPPTVSFLKDVAPILVQNCIACHNPKKSESKYTMTTFAALAKGGVKGKGITIVPGDPDASYFVELCQPDGEPRMPYKQDPLPKEKLEILERWVKQGAKYDGAAPVGGLARRAPQSHAGLDPRRLSRHRPHHRAGDQPRRRGGRRVGLPRGHDVEGARRFARPSTAGDGRAGPRHRV